MDEGLDDCLVGACGSQGIHRGEVRPHESGPETDGQVLTGHQVQPVQLAHPGKKHANRHRFIHTVQRNRWVSTARDQQMHRSDLNSRRGTYLCKWLSTYLKTS